MAGKKKGTTRKTLVTLPVLDAGSVSPRKTLAKPKRIPRKTLAELPERPVMPGFGGSEYMELFGRPQRIVELDARKSDMHAIAHDFYAQESARGVPVAEFRCDDGACVGVLVNGKVHHSWNCSWWQRPENKLKTPF